MDLDHRSGAGRGIRLAVERLVLENPGRGNGVVNRVRLDPGAITTSGEAAPAVHLAVAKVARSLR